MERTQPLLMGTETTGGVQVIGLNENLQPKLKALSLMKETVTIGLKKDKYIFFKLKINL
jgi:hypothetical protein